MKNYLFLSIFFSIFICFTTSCSNKYAEAELHGQWKVSQWKVESSGKLISNKMDMDFNAEGEYTIDYGPKKETGKYWIVDDYLHTHGKGLSEKSVRILGLTSDSLTIQMNRAGEMEKVILLRN